jgi:hypothetical protein
VSTPEQAGDRYEIPTFGECVVGYRTWDVDDRDQLWPIWSDRRPWAPGINTARCNCESPNSLRFEWSLFEGRRVLEPSPQHPAPMDGCECGLYSWRHPSPQWGEDPLRSSPPRVIGAVASWGAIQVHDDGFRAQHACVVALAFHPSTQPEALAALERIAGRYRVDLVPLGDLGPAASRHGSPLPDELRPQPPATHEVANQEPGEPVRRAPDATVDDIGSPTPVGFNGRPLKESSSLYGGGTGM